MEGVPDQPRLVTGDIVPPTVRAGVSARADDASPPDDRTDRFSGFGSSDRPKGKAGPLLFCSTVCLAAFLVFWVSGGHRLVLDPLAATIRNSPAQALQIENVTSRVEQRDGRAHLVIDGSAHNRGGEAMTLSSIVIAVSETDGATIRYHLGTNQALLAPGQAYGFSSRLYAPAKGVASVSITFQEGSR